jgi:hypothetical protein
MPTVTDIAVIIFLLLLAANGAYQGFLRSLVGPASLIISLIAGALVYFNTRNFSASFLIAVLGPFFFAWIIVSALKSWLNPYDEPKLSLVSRILGQLVNLAWGIGVVIFLVAFLAFFPFNQFDLGGVTKDVRKSLSYSLITPIFANSPFDTTPRKSTGCLLDTCSAKEEDVQALASDKEIQAIANDPRIQKMMADPDIRTAAQKQDIKTLLTNPAMRELMNDPAFLIKALKAYPKIQKLRTLQQNNPAPASPERPSSPDHPGPP